jgi:type I restriction enzyme M protein
MIQKLSPTGTAGCVVTSGRYVGAEAVEEDGEPFEEKMRRLTNLLAEHQAESTKLERFISENLKGLGYAK